MTSPTTRWATALGRTEGFTRLVPTVSFAMVTGAETVSVLKVVFLVMIVAGVVGLEMAH
ncbi:hypothetical protein [Nocardia fluminea]|uniref:hypothetical protein n=1 Tax=Nocardia fluminea TaxID=134984 RepID=UPI003D0F5450